MRKHLYLVTEHPEEKYVGQVRSVDKRYARGKMNEERPIDKRDIETGETWVEYLVGLGYHDFEDQEDYEERFAEVAKAKLREIDDEHLDKAGVELEEASA